MSNSDWTVGRGEPLWIMYRTVNARPRWFTFLYLHVFVRLIQLLCILFEWIDNKICHHMKEINALLFAMVMCLTCAWSDFSHEVTNCIELLESLSFSTAFCQSCRPPTTESCCFAKWPHLWQSWRTISAIATFFISGLMVSARGRRTFQLLTDTTSSHLSSRFGATDSNRFLSASFRQCDMIKESRSILQRVWFFWLKVF